MIMIICQRRKRQRRLQQSPRFNFNYKLDNSSSLRGYGISYDKVSILFMVMFG
jgi:hypothetical protein